MKKTSYLLLTVYFMLTVLLVFPTSVTADSDVYPPDPEGYFRYEGNYIYVVSNEEATILYADKFTSLDVIIPSELGGFTVTSISNGAFNDFTTIESVTIPDSVTDIGKDLFSQCDNLKTVCMPYALKDKVEFTSNPEIICSCKITYILDGETIAEEWVTEGGKFTFPNMTDTENYNYSFWVNDTQFYSHSIVQCDTEVNIIKDPKAPQTEGYYTYMIYYGAADITKADPEISGDITVPSHLGGYPVNFIDEFAFDQCNNITSITIPEGVYGAWTNAFNNCEKLTSITLPDTMENAFGESVFSCENLAEINVSENNPYLCTIDGALYDKKAKMLIAVPMQQTSLTLPDSFAGFTGNIEYCLKNVTTLTIPNDYSKLNFILTDFAVFDYLETVYMPYSLKDRINFRNNPNIVYSCKVTYKLKRQTIAEEWVTYGEGATITVLPETDKYIYSFPEYDSDIWDGRNVVSDLDVVVTRRLRKTEVIKNSCKVSGDTFTYSFNIKTESENGIHGSFIAAVYDDKGELIGIRTESIDSADTEADIGNSFAVTAEPKTCKVFFWKDTDSIMPLCDVLSFDIN